MCVQGSDIPPPEAPPPHQSAAESAAGMSDNSVLVLKWVWPTIDMSNPPGGTGSEKEIRSMLKS